MTRDRLLQASGWWFRLVARCYPPDFRDELGAAMVDTYMDRTRNALRTGGGALRVAALWLRALVDSLRNGIAERVRPAAAWRRGGSGNLNAGLVVRRLVRAPGFAVATIGTLTVGLGMFAVVYTAVQRVLIDPMPYKSPGDLYYVWRDYGPITDMKRGALAGTDVVELQKPTAVLEGGAGLQSFLGGNFALREGGDAMDIAVTRTSPNLFDLLGVTPMLGRTFAPDEVGPGREQRIVLTYALWHRLGADPGIVGTDVRLQNRPFTVLGVLPPDFTFVRSDEASPPQPVEAFTPFAVHLAEANPRRGAYVGLVRARPGASPAAVAAAVDAVGHTIDARDFSSRGLKLYPVALKADVISRIRPALIALAAAGAVLLVMLMVNLASVLLARAAQREHEVAVSRALGAGTAAVVRSVLLEGGLLGLAGGALGALAAVWGTRALVALAPLDLPRREAIAVDWRIALTVVAVGVALGLLAAAAPALWAARTSLSSLLAASAVRGGGGGQGRLRRGLIAAQVALSLVLLSSGALVVRSFEQLMRTDPGFRSSGVFTVRVRTPPEFFPKSEDAAAFQERVQRTLAAIPGVTGAGATSSLPLTASSFPGGLTATVTVPGSPGNTGDVDKDALPADLIGIRPGYVETMGMRLVAGRTFTEYRSPGMAEALIDSAIVRRFFTEGNPLGATIKLGDRSFIVVGVVDQARLYEVHADGRPQVLVRAEDQGVRPLFYVMRTTRDPRSLLPDVQAAIRRLEPRLAAGNPRAMDDIVQDAVSPQAIGGALIGTFAIGALLLAAMGLFGVVSGSVTQRRHELAVRLALGADHRRVLGLVLSEGVRLVGVGLLLGVPGIYAANGLIGGLLVGVTSSDPLTLLTAGCALLLVTTVTCYVPARRALRIDPARLLANE